MKLLWIKIIRRDKDQYLEYNFQIKKFIFFHTGEEDNSQEAEGMVTEP